MPNVDPQMAEILALIAALDLPPYESMDAVAARAAAEERNVFWNEGNPDVASVRDLTLPGPTAPLRLRLYEPAGVGPTSPGVLYIHGGGWVICSLDTHDGVCRRLANASGLPLRFLAVGVAMAVGLVSPVVWGIASGQPVVDLGLALLWGTDWNVFFPLFPWIVYPLVGFAYGRVVVSSAVPRAVVRRAGVIGLGLGLAGIGLIAAFHPTIAVSDYWRQAPPILLAIVGLVLAWLAVADFVVGAIRATPGFAVLSGWSRRVTSMYCVLWILIGWGVALVGHRRLELPAVVLAIVAVLVVTDRVTLALPTIAGATRRAARRSIGVPAEA